MTDKEAYKLIGERAEELTRMKDVQIKMIEISKKEGKEKAASWLYKVAIASLIG